MKATFAAFALLSIVALCMVPAGADGASEVDISGETNIIKIRGSETFDAVYTNTDYDDLQKYAGVEHDVSYNAKLVNSTGETQTNGVSPSKGDTSLGEVTSFTVTAPSDSGKYRLVVEYTDKITYTDVATDKAETVTVVEEKEYLIRVVQPINLTVTVEIPEDSNVDLKAYGVYFVVDGEKKDDSYTTFTTNASGEATATYELVAILSGGKHTFSVVPADGEMITITGLDKTHTFYIGDNDYTMYIVISVLFVILMIVIMIWIARKPVKNFGKPKARR